jgi:hypothetical protein
VGSQLGHAPGRRPVTRSGHGFGLLRPREWLLLRGYIPWLRATVHWCPWPAERSCSGAPHHRRGLEGARVARGARSPCPRGSCGHPAGARRRVRYGRRRAVVPRRPRRCAEHRRTRGAWEEARALALTRKQVASPLAGRRYDFRHAALSTWLNAGVDPTDVAERAGNGVGCPPLCVAWTGLSLRREEEMSVPKGLYSLRDPSEGTVVGYERFSCARGPVGWRYAAEVLAPDGRTAAGLVDITVDDGWRQTGRGARRGVGRAWGSRWRRGGVGTSWRVGRGGC